MMSVLKHRPPAVLLSPQNQTWVAVAFEDRRISEFPTAPRYHSSNPAPQSVASHLVQSAEFLCFLQRGNLGSSLLQATAFSICSLAKNPSECKPALWNHFSHVPICSLPSGGLSWSRFYWPHFTNLNVTHYSECVLFFPFFFLLCLRHFCLQGDDHWQPELFPSLMQC